MADGPWDDEVDVLVNPEIPQDTTDQAPGAGRPDPIAAGMRRSRSRGNGDIARFWRDSENAAVMVIPYRILHRRPGAKRAPRLTEARLQAQALRTGCKDAQRTAGH
jgi:hypothetical protein